MPTVILAIVIFIAALLVFIAVRLLKDIPDKSELARLKAREEDLALASQKLTASGCRIETLQKENAALTANLQNEKINSQEKIKLLQATEERLKKEFENLAKNILEKESKTFTEQNREKLITLLQPFREQMESFRRRVDEVHVEDTKRSAQLLTQVRLLQEASSQVSKDAENLANAIKGDSKTQGDWGEFIVERIFEASGLKQGREYETQTSFRDEDGRLKRPDFVVNLPGDRIIIVDSKVSLTAYERYVNAEDDSAREMELKAHVLSIRKHVDELKAKNYQNIRGNRSLDFVIMCIPLEPAYQTALQADPNLLYNLSSTNVVVSGPSTLMVTLKLIGQIWRRENENRNAELIADRAGRLYDKFAGMVEALNKTKTQFETASGTLEKAIIRATGQGGLSSQFEKLRELGAKTTKQLAVDQGNGKAPPELPEGLDTEG